MKRRRGMTLVEVMVVIAILAALAGAVAVGALKHLAKAKVDRAWMDLRAISNSLELYRVRHGRYPDPARPLADWRAELAISTTRDPWGNPYLYLLEAGEPVVRSHGEDGEPGGEELAADLSSAQLDPE